MKMVMVVIMKKRAGVCGGVIAAAQGGREDLGSAERSRTNRSSLLSS